MPPEHPIYCPACDRTISSIMKPWPPVHCPLCGMQIKPEKKEISQ